MKKSKLDRELELEIIKYIKNLIWIPESQAKKEIEELIGSFK